MLTNYLATLESIHAGQLYFRNRHIWLLADQLAFLRPLFPAVADAGVEGELGSAPSIDLQLLHEDTARDLSSTPAPNRFCLDDVDTADAAAAAASALVVFREPAEIAVQQARVPTEDTALAIPDERTGASLDRLSRLYPNSIHTSDLKHVVDNLLHECLDCMAVCLECIATVFEVSVCGRWWAVHW